MNYKYLLAIPLLPLGIVATALLLAILLALIVILLPVLTAGTAFKFMGFVFEQLENSFLQKYLDDNNLLLFFLQSSFILIAYVPTALTVILGAALISPIVFIALSVYLSYRMSELIIDKINHFYEEEENHRVDKVYQISDSDMKKIRDHIGPEEKGPMQTRNHFFITKEPNIEIKNKELNSTVNAGLGTKTSF